MQQTTKTKTHETVHLKIKPGQSFTLKSGDVIENLGTHNIYLRVRKPVETESFPNESDK